MGLLEPDIGTQLAPGRTGPGATGRSLAAGRSGGPEAGGWYAKAGPPPVTSESMLRLVWGTAVAAGDAPLDWEPLNEDFVVTPTLARLLLKLARRRLDLESRHPKAAPGKQEDAA